MARAKQPVSVGGIEFDALIDQSDKLENTVPQYAVEKGYAVSDNIVNEAESLSMTLFLTATPVTWYAQHGGDPNRVENVVKQIRSLYFSREPVTVITTDMTYTNMAIESIEIRKSTDIGYAREIPISFKRVRITEATTTTIPDSYGKSGATGASAGSANTSEETTDSDSDSDSESNGTTILNVGFDGIMNFLNSGGTHGFIGTEASLSN